MKCALYIRYDNTRALPVLRLTGTSREKVLILFIRCSVMKPTFAFVCQIGKEVSLPEFFRRFLLSEDSHL